ncbi:MAG: InlB B-repeat-containing protein [Desulfobulbaceae bacterium]
MRRFCMTHLLVVVVILCSFQPARAAVLLVQGFDDVENLLVDGWYQVNNSVPLGFTEWFQGVEAMFPAQAGTLPNSYAAANYDNTGVDPDFTGTISNWLISPELDFAATGQISFWTRTVDAPAFPDRLQVRLSTNGASTNVGTTATDWGDFATVLVDINPDLVLDAYPVGYPTGWTRYVISSASLPASGSGRIAFRYFVTNGGGLGTNSDYIGIDTFEVLSKTYTLTYTAGANGTISGTTPQTVDHGTDGTAVTAVPDSGYHFVNWSDGSTANPRTDTNVVADISVTANFANTYTLTYTAGANGSISGTTPQAVLPGGDGAAVTAVPVANYHFVNWSDGSTANPRTDTNVMQDITVTANFAINTYTLTYTADANGTITGTTPQTVNHGASGTAVTAVPNTGYHFVNWSDASTANPRIDSNVTADITVTANFAINTYTLTYTADANGTITGTTPQTVNHGASGTAVTAVPNTGYHFVDWSDGSTANPRTDSNVTADITVTANFAINTYTLTYTAGANGTLTGTTPQTVNHGASGTAVTAVPNNGYHFVDWSDGSTANPRTDTNVTANISVMANFARDTQTLKVQLTGSGKGRVTSDPAGIDCQGDCEEVYDFGTVVTLTAAPEARTTFKGWSGDCSGTDVTCTVTMAQARNVTAEFYDFPWNLFLPAILNPVPTP